MNEPSEHLLFGGRMGLALAAGGCAGLIGGLALMGWLADVPALKSLLPGLVAMKFNTALGLVLLSAALLLGAGRGDGRSTRRGLSRACAGLAGLLGLLTLAEYLFGAGIGIDNLFFTEPAGAALTLYPGRMSIAAAAEFSALGTALLLPRGGRGRVCALWLSGAALAVSGLSFLGYAFDLPLLYQFGRSTPIAVHTAAAFALIAAGSLAVRLKTGFSGLVSRKTVYAGFAAALAAMLLVCAGVFRRIEGLCESSRRVEHTYKALADKRDLLAAAAGAESASRGYAISGDREFRDDFREARDGTRAALEHLSSAVRGSPSQQQGLAAITAAALEKIAFMERVTAARERRGKAAALDLIAGGRGEKLMDFLQTAAAGFEAEERRLLLQREAEARSQASRTIVSLTAGTAVSALLLACCLWALARENDLRRAGEERMRKLNELLARHARFFSLSVDMFCLAGTDGYFKELSPAWERTLGWSSDELMARPYLEFVHPGDRAATIEKAAALARAEAVVMFENRYLCRDGSYKWLQWNSVFDAGSGTIYAVIRDISSLKNAERALLEANKELDAFTYSVSHDLRAPLRAIGGFSRMLLDGGHAGGLDAEGQRLLGVVRSSAAAMGRLIDDLLTFSRLGRKPLEAGAVDMAALARSVAAGLLRDSPNPALKIAVGDLPPARGDRAMLQQVFANLIGNAVKYSSKKAAPAVEVGAEREDGGTAYFVRDNGAGFDMRYAGKLFGVFQRLHRADEFEGTGVGLALVERIVRRHGGRVRAEGKVGEGAVFRFTLPDKEKGESHERS